MIFPSYQDITYKFVELLINVAHVLSQLLGLFDSGILALRDTGVLPKTETETMQQTSIKCLLTAVQYLPFVMHKNNA